MQETALGILPKVRYIIVTNGGDIIKDDGVTGYRPSAYNAHAKQYPGRNIPQLVKYQEQLENK